MVANNSVCRSQYGSTPLEYAKACNKHEAAALLEEVGLGSGGGAGGRERERERDSLL